MNNINACIYIEWYAKGNTFVWKVENGLGLKEIGQAVSVRSAWKEAKKSLKHMGQIQKKDI